MAARGSTRASNLYTAVWLAVLVTRCSGFNVCVFTDGPAGYAQCTPGGASTSATGYDVELFRKTAAAMGWTEVQGSTSGINLSTATSINSTYAFVCLPPTTDRQNLLRGMSNGTLDNTTCTVAIGRVMHQGSLAVQGAKYSQPWLKAGIVIVVDTGVVAPVNMWSWTKPFSNGVWATLACNLILVAVVLWLVERFQRPGAKMKITLEELDHLRLNTYRTILGMFNQDIMPVNSPVGQLIVVVYLFSILILLATYTANLTANLTLNNQAGTITNIRELQIMKVMASSDVILPLNEFYQVMATPIDLNNDGAWQTVIEGLASAKYDAFVARLPDVEYYRNRFNSGCRLNYAASLAGYRPTNLGPLFHTLVPQNIVTLFGARIWAQRDNSFLYKLQASQLMLGNTTCPVIDPTVTTSTPVKLGQLLGLWIILAVGFGAALIQASWMVFQYARTTMKEATLKGDTTMTLGRAMSTMVLKNAPEEDTDLPPEMRTHKICSALEEMMMRRQNSGGSMKSTMASFSRAPGGGAARRASLVEFNEQRLQELNSPSAAQIPPFIHTKSQRRLSGAVPTVGIDTPASPVHWSPLVTDPLTAPTNETNNSHDSGTKFLSEPSALPSALGRGVGTNGPSNLGAAGHVEQATVVQDFTPAGEVVADPGSADSSSAARIPPQLEANLEGAEVEDL